MLLPGMERLGGILFRPDCLSRRLSHSVLPWLRLDDSADHQIFGCSRQELRRLRTQKLAGNVGKREEHLGVTPHEESGFDAQPLFHRAAVHTTVAM